jgi:hypothetical protein
MRCGYVLRNSAGRGRSLKNPISWFRRACATHKACVSWKPEYVPHFAGKCITQVKSAMKTIRNAFEAGRPPKVRKNSEVGQSLLAVTKDDSLAAVESALQALVRVEKAVVYRRELLREMQKAIRAAMAGEAPGLEEAVWVVRNRSRRLGRILPRCAVGTTLLVKGLEFHAKNLYVALTRGAKSLTIASRWPVIQPKGWGAVGS